MAGSSSSSRTNMKLVRLHLTSVNLSASAGQTGTDTLQLTQLQTYHFTQNFEPVACQEF